MRISNQKISTARAAGKSGCQPILNLPLLKSMSCLWLTLAVLLALLPTPYATAQVITASVAGNVFDSSGAVIPGAMIKASNVNTGYTQSVTSAGDGGYRIGSLPVGPYVVEISAPGFKSLKQRDVVLNVDQTFSLNATLTIGVQTDVVTVTDAPPQSTSLHRRSDRPFSPSRSRSFLW